MERPPTPLAEQQKINLVPNAWSDRRLRRELERFVHSLESRRHPPPKGSIPAIR